MMDCTEDVSLKAEACGETLTEDQDAKEVDNDPEISLRLKVCNIPFFLKYPQVKKFLDLTLKGMAWRKLKTVPGVAYFSMTTEEDTAKVLELLDGMEYKAKTLIAKRVANEGETRPQKKENTEQKLRTTAEITTPLAGSSYEDQLAFKVSEAQKTVHTLIKQFDQAKITGSRYIKAHQILKPIVKSPVLTDYRNKCEFTIGRDVNGDPCVGFVSGCMANKECVIVPVEDSSIMTKNMHKIVKIFNDFVKKSDLEPFDEFSRAGFWKMLTIRDFVGDCMLIFTVYPLEDEEKLKLVQKELINTFIDFGQVSNLQMRVTSIYWQVLKNASDPCIYQHLEGVPFIYETILGVRFRISPATFFQTNSRAAAVLYTKIGDFLGLPQCPEFSSIVKELVIVKKEDTSEEDPKAKRARPEENTTEPEDISKPLIILDICCGAGTIGQCMLRRIERAVQAGTFQGQYACVGVELIDQAVKDARVNALDNGFDEQICRYVCGQAESVFRDLSQFFPTNVNADDCRMVGVLDPPRAGLSDKVIISCRRLMTMKRLVYVSCDPRAALKNIVDLCRPESKKYEGPPFKLHSIQPVDMFPQTKHCEWVILLVR